MDKEQHNEIMYQLSMSVARKLFYKNLITRDELKEMHEMLVKKYHPYIGELLSAKELINYLFRVIYRLRKGGIG